MRSRLLLLLPVLFVAGLAGWAALRVARPEPEWTTSSPAALAELQRGLEAERKFYRQEALSHFAAALELDPDFAAARLMLLRDSSREPAEREKLREELRSTDRSRLTAREAFLVDYWLAMHAEDRERAATLLREFLAAHPEDPYALMMEAGRLWEERRFAPAEQLYLRLLAVDPNWVLAQNHLGYVAMSQGQLALAEDRFRTYRYVAPDQANPHDSLGELMVLQGRWEEARRELEEALRIRPDFCASYYNLVYVALFTDDYQAGRRAIERAEREGSCPAVELDRQRCRLELWEQLAAGELAQLAAGYEQSCTFDQLTSPWVPHLAALRLGDLAKARLIEDHVAAQIADLPSYARVDRSSVQHLEAARMVSEGRPAEAARQLQEIDSQLDYFGAGVGTFKLFNRLLWAHALELAGEPARAAELIGQVEAVNRPLAAAYRAGEVPLPEPLPASPAAPSSPAAGPSASGR